MRKHQHGFTLVELAVVFTIVILLLGSLMYTLSAQSEQRNYEETRRRLEQAKDLVWTLCSLVVYDLLVTERGWTDERYEAWLAAALARELLGE